MDRDVLARAGVTITGFTETISSGSDLASYTGTRLYMAPELLAGRPPSIQSDIYSLGVLLYQMLVGDLTQPMTTDWERRIRDPLLRDDLRVGNFSHEEIWRHCSDGGLLSPRATPRNTGP